ncbi:MULTISPECIES: hypothetical protein [Lactobacillus]|uniref:Surface layer protein A domain-containing protein n=1 Tax=Lactobacillus xujianguonis TaxID=2495899 RepID=A0A437SUW7_9LACO|nr:MULTISPECIES: hypothetical protein [Lactobacillus]RVU70733.1 hypothetical protein EJK17_05670 [Lactobacillus xujianguonis]RVU72051.1 hypothetical protein EJK20_11040 [Lactobacillus xujianguonis]
MKHRILITALASVMLAGGVGAVATPAQPVQAISKLAAVSYARGYRKVKITKRINVAKIHLRIPRYKSTISDNYYVAKGTTVYIWRTGTDFGWYLKPRRHSKVTYTVDKRLNDSSWYKLK